MDKLIKYFREVQGILQEEGVEKDIVLQNAFAEIDGNEFRLACHHDGSVVLEQLLAGASAHQLAVFLDRLKNGDAFGRLLAHRYGSHVIETALVQFIGKGDYESESFDSAGIMKDFLGQTVSNEDLPYDTFASKVLRKVMNALASSSLSCKGELMGMLKEGLVKFDLEAMAKDACGSLYLQDCVQCFDDSFCEHCCTNLPLYEFSFDRNASRVVECILVKTSSVKSIWKKVFKGKVKALFEDRTGNFVLQKLISVADAKVMEGVVEELKEVENVWQHPGVLLKLAETEGTGMHKKVYKLITKGLNSPVMDLAILKGGQGFKPLGCQILSNLLHYDVAINKPLYDFFYDDLTSEQFLQMALDKHASRTLQALLSLIKSPQKFVKRTAGSFAKLANDANGSHILELLFERSSMDDKQVIANELKDKRKVVMDGSRYGSIVWNNLRMEEFIHNRERWLSFGEQLHKRKELFKDILEDEEVGKTNLNSKKHKK